MEGQPGCIGGHSIWKIENILWWNTVCEKQHKNEGKMYPQTCDSCGSVENAQIFCRLLHAHLLTFKRAVDEMRASLICSSVILLIFSLCGIQSSLGIDVLENTAPNSDLLKRERRDEEPQYPDDSYDSGEQDRWPTMEELAKYSNNRLSTKRGGVLNGPAGLYDLMSSKRRPDRRTIDSLKDAYVAKLLKRHRMPRSSEVTTMEPDKDQPIFERLIVNESNDDLSE
ncbi:PREDICTED: uncharacterized protein LOC108784470 [Nanorana parkeri]|uniref:uncharacterized protein LOC108784470 n=1 Tax=Nanorana parkeri TaxID=125878 RepID=UPI0008543797|nr:PREDICTED: uncharacterized protein LOC108784470 [Nanorana parkeri]